MIAYRENLDTFYNHINTNVIVNKIIENLGHNVGESERRSFRNSLPAIANALHNANLPGDVEVALEYKIPLTNRRIDFMIAGADENGKDHLVICELKQWDEVLHTDMKDIVLVGNQEHVHPSWQAYTYGSTLKNFNEYIEKNDVEINTCTFLHNYKREYIGELCNNVYEEGLEKAEPFISDQYVELSKFVSKYIKTKSKRDLLYEVENGKIKPSKMLTDALGKMLNGNDEFELIQEQRIVFSNLLNEVKKNQNSNEKQVFIIRGGAGTGKSVIAIKLLGTLIKEKGLKAFYVSKSGYVRENYYKKLTRDIPNYSFLRTLFLGSSSFIDSINNEFDVLIVDEAHRLTEKTKKSWFYVGENQVKEIIKAAKTSIFFIDETQHIDIKDYGTIDNITRCANELGATIHLDDKYILKSQFRCNGSDEYIAWLDSILYNKPFVSSGESVDYDIKIIDDIMDFKKEIVKKNNESKIPSRMLSGDVFPWITRTKENANKFDIMIDGFIAKWNKTKAFATDPKSIDEVGCIHTSQGMEFNYAGVIIGDDLIYRNNRIETDYTKHPKGAAEFKRPHQRRVLEEDASIVDQLIRNTYKVLLTRGQKGCYLYVMDKQLREYLREKIKELKNG